MFSERWRTQSLLTRRKGDATRKLSQGTANVAIVRWKAFMHLSFDSPFKKNSLSPSTVMPDENTPRANL